MQNEETLKHLAFVILHGGLTPERGFGGCSCEVCEALRAYIRAHEKMESEEFVENLRRQNVVLRNLEI